MLPTTRISDLKGALAVQVLEARTRGKSDVEVVIELPYVSATTYLAAREFMQRVAPEVRFRLVGSDGSHATLSRKRETKSFRKPAARAPSRTGSAELFTDMNQWILKLLLLSPHAERPSSLRELAKVTETSLPTAQRFVEAFGELGHVVKSDDGYVVARKSELMRRWLASVEMTRDWRMPVRARYGRTRLLSALAAHVAADRGYAALGGFAACETRRMLHVVEPGPMEIHIDGRSMNVINDNTERCERRDADALIVPSAAFAASIFRPLRWEKPARTGLVAVDPIQAALDVWTQPLGGKEQARFIIDEGLKWRDGD